MVKKKEEIYAEAVIFLINAMVELITTYSACRKVFTELTINQKAKKNLVQRDRSVEKVA